MRARTSFHAASALVRLAALLAVAQVALLGCSADREEAEDAHPIAFAGALTAASGMASAMAPSEFALRAQRGIRLQQRATVTGGDVGVALARRADGHSLRLDERASVSGGARVVAPAVLLSRGAVAGDVFTDRLQDRGSTHGRVQPYAEVSALEPLVAVEAGTSAVTVEGEATLAAGAWGDVAVGPEAVLRLDGGEYALASLRLAPRARLVALATARVRVATRLDAASESVIEIAGGAGSAKDLRIEVAGADRSSVERDEETGELAAARLGERSSVRALVSAPAGTIVVGANASVVGALAANAVLIRPRASIVFEDGFAEESSCPAGCDDGNACTSDACVAGACRHDPATAGTPCADDDACDGEEACDGAGACLPGVALASDDGNPCTADSCDPGSGVVHVAVAAGTSCSDADACNGLEACDGEGTCLSGAPAAVDDGDACTADACDPAGGVIHTAIAGCPAPPPPPPEPSFAEATAYLYSGDAPSQLGVQPGAIDPARVAVVRGAVLDRDAGPLGGARVEVFDHPELGWTLTRDGGGFDLAVNGGATIVLAYAKDGYPSAHRSLDVPSNDFAAAADVALVALDPIATPIMAGVPFPQVARATRVFDSSGARQAVLFFQPFTTARMTLPDGSAVPLATAQVRATEFTVGLGWSLALPADLPPQVVYPYAVELSVDEAAFQGAQEVRFEPAVALYVENTRGFPVGTPLAVGSYDRTIAAWLAQPEGRVVAFLGLAAGLAELDTDGDGLADDPLKLAALGITFEERQRLGAFYFPGQSLWRVPVRRFGPLYCDAP